MKRIIIAGILGVVISLVGCGKKETSTPITIYLGIYEDGSGFWDWDGNLSYKTQNNGRLDWATPMSMSGTFGPPSYSDAVTLDLKLDVDPQTNYIIKGVAEAKQPASLVLLGTGQDKTTNKRINLTIGQNKVDFTGELLATFPKK